jgi:CSLREA domain-containing protein
MGLRHGHQRHVLSISRRLAACGAASALGIAGVLVASTAAGAAVGGPQPMKGVAHASMPARVPPTSLLGRPAAGRIASRMPRRAPRYVAPRGVVAKVFTVTVLADSPLAAPGSHACVDAATHACSLRAAVQAANNLDKPVVIKLGAHIYQLTDSVDGALILSNPAGTTIEGVSAAVTRVAVPFAGTYGAFEVESPAHTGSTGTFSNLTVTGGNVASSYGGGIYVTGFDVAAVLDNVDVTHNTAEYGGGVACYEANVWITGSSVNSDTAEEGGGFYEYFCNAYLSHSTFNADTAATVSTSGDGGGLYDYYGNVRATNCSVNGDIAGNATEAGYGGGIYGYYGGTTLLDTTVNHDTTMDQGQGGGVYLSYATLDATASSFSYDRAGGGADAAGGGIAESGEGNVALHGVQVDHDSTSATDNYYGGGGIYVYADEEPAFLAIDSNSTVSDDSTSGIVGVSYYAGNQFDISQTSFMGDSSTLQAAGGIYLYAYEYGQNALLLSGDTFVGNHDDQSYSAGGVMAYSYEYESSTIVVTHCTFKSNIASGEYGTGGIGAYSAYYYSPLTMKITDSTITDNHATYNGYGGGVSLWNEESDSSSVLELNGDTIQGNTAGSSTVSREGYGGGVFTEYYVVVTISSTTLSDNTALGVGTSSGEGGGLYNGTYLGIELLGSKIVGNRALGTESYGGGAYTYPEYGSLIMRNTTVDSNTAIYGGGMYVSYYGADIIGSTFAHNVAGTPAAAGQGGALYTYDAPAEISNSTFTGNEAVASHASPGQGGAIYIDEYLFALYYVTMSQNVARQGAAIYSSSEGSGTLRDSIVVQNVTVPKGTTQADCYGVAHVNVFVSLGGNVLSNGGCVESVTPTDDITTKPGLDPLAANGGLTETMALQPSSPAINAAHGDCLASDQRGMARPTTGLCDAGAYELVKVKKTTTH